MLLSSPPSLLSGTINVLKFQLPSPNCWQTPNKNIGTKFSQYSPQGETRLSFTSKKTLSSINDILLIKIGKHLP